MSVELDELTGEIAKTQEVLNRLSGLYLKTVDGMSTQDKTLERAVLLAEIMVNYYTCMETLFFRISQFFENSLSKDRWHSELLHKMTLRIPNVREPVISDETFSLLEEFRKFRHFKRYYFSMDYDWDRLDYLGKQFLKLISRYPEDLTRFITFLDNLQE